LRERMEGKTAYAIARDLNKDAVPTAQGGGRPPDAGPRGRCADDQILIYRSRRSSAHNGSRGYEARHSVRLMVDRVSVESRKGISTRSLAAHEA
jgi:hypothetical protein